MIGSALAVTLLIGVAVVCAALYLLPVLVGWARQVPDIGAIAVIDILLGWTFLGWVLALAMALRSVPPASPVVQVVQNMPPPYLPPARPFAGWAGPPGPPPLRAASPPPLEFPPRH